MSGHKKPQEAPLFLNCPLCNATSDFLVDGKCKKCGWIFQTNTHEMYAAQVRLCAYYIARWHLLLDQGEVEEVKQEVLSILTAIQVIAHTIGLTIDPAQPDTLIPWILPDNNKDEQ